MKGPKPTQDKTIPIGSTVKVFNALRQYSSYKDMAVYMGLTNWTGRRSVKEGYVYTVVAKARHENDCYGELLGLMDGNGDSYMIGIEGVERLSVEATQESKPFTGLSGQVAVLELQLQAALSEVETLKALVENIKNLVK